MSSLQAGKSRVAPLLLALVFALAFAAYLPGYVGAQEEKPVPEPQQPEPQQPQPQPQQPEPEPVEPVKYAASDLEDKARGFEARGRYYEAVVTYREEALIKAIELAEAAGQGEQAMAYWAEAEIYMDRAVSLMYQQPRPDYKDICTGLEKLGQDHKLPAVFDGWRKWALANALVRTGEIDRAKETCRELGFVTNWMIIGPFQNERGTCWNVPYGPETELDLKAAYDGKKRKVRWRMLPVEPLLAEVNFDAMMRPNDEVLAYALAFVDMPEATEAALRIASDEGLMVWVNDLQVLDRDIHRRLDFDQDVVGVKLNAGVNKILVKVSERNGEWGFRLRITTPDGSKLAFKPVTAIEDFQKQFETPTYTKETEKPQVEVARGSIGFYEKYIQKNPDDALAQAHLGYLHLVHPFEDENAYKDRTAFEKCVELEPDNPYYHFMLAEAYEMVARMEAEKEGNKARLSIEKAIEIEPEYVEALLHMARYYLNDMKNWHKAKKYLDRALKVNPDYFHALLLDIDILQARSFATEVRLRTLALEKHPKVEVRTSPAVLRRLVEIYSQGSRPQKMVETLKLMLSQDYSDIGARYSLLRYYRGLGQLEKVLEQFEILAGIDPYAISNYVNRAEIYEGLDEFEKAIAEMDKALAVCPEAEDELVKKGNLLMRLSLERGEDTTGEIYAQALKLFEKTRRINPNNTWLKRYTEFLQEEKKSFEEHERLAAEVEVKPDDGIYIKSKRIVLDGQGEPVMLEGKPQLEDMIAHFTHKELDAQAKKENLPFMCVLSKQVTNVRKDGTSSEFIHFVIKICTEEGTQRFRGFPTTRFLTSYSQEVKVKKARVIHKDGSEEEGRSSRWGVIFPPLKVGDVLDVQFRLDDQMTDLTERFFGDYYGNTHIFHNSFNIGFGDIPPIKLAQYFLMLPKDRKFYLNHLNTEVRPRMEPGLSKKNDMRVWEFKDLPYIVAEILMPPIDQILPAVQISSFGDWKEFGKWFYNLVKKQYDTSPEIKKKVKELTAGKETELEKIRAIYDFVVTDISYQALEYGIHGWQPYKASTIFAKMHGDCKDKALLINTMLKEVGIKSLPVLIGASALRGKPDMTLPMIRHFNHCIAYAPPSEERKKGIWMDGTAEFYGLTDGPPFMDWGAPTLVVDEDGGQVIVIPLPDPKENVQSENTVVELTPEGSAKVRTKLTMSGDNSARVRGVFSVEGRRNVILERRYSQFAGTKIIAPKFPDLKDLSAKSLTYSYQLEIPNFVKKTPEGLALEHDFFAMPWSELTPQAQRKLPMALPYIANLLWRQHVIHDPLWLPMPGTLRSDMTFVLPEGFKVLSLPKNEKFSSEFADFDLTFEKEDGKQPKVFVKRSLTFKKNDLSLEEYGKLRKLTNLLEKTQKEKVTIKEPKEKPEKEPPPEEEGPPREGRKIPVEPPGQPPATSPGK